MGENNRLIEYHELWDKFIVLLDKNNIKLYEFANNWDKFDWMVLSDKEYSQKKFYDILRDLKKNKDGLTRVQQKNIDRMREYIKFLDKSFVTLDLNNVGKGYW
jgi:hypothetical protein